MQTGLARGARLMVLDRRRRGEHVAAIDLTGSLHMPEEVPANDVHVPANLVSMNLTDLVIHVNPPQFFDALRAFDAAALRRVRIIGMWVWELEKVPPIWRECAKYCDEIWAPSLFAAEAIRRSLHPFGGRIAIMPHPVDADPFSAATPETRNRIRSLLGLSNDTFVVGYSFSMASNYARKNPMGAVEVFQRSFDDEADCRLLLRCNDARQFIPGWEELKRAASEDRRVILLDGNTGKIGISEFYALLDVYLSLHRSEGYGLCLAEAAQTGLPVVTTGWGLAADIAARPEIISVGYRLIPIKDAQGAYRSLPDLYWAEADLEETAVVLRRLKDQHDSCDKFKTTSPFRPPPHQASL